MSIEVDLLIVGPARSCLKEYSSLLRMVNVTRALWSRWTLSNFTAANVADRTHAR